MARRAPGTGREPSRVRGASAAVAAMGDGLRNIPKRKGQALLLAASVGLGVALAIAIIAASNGVEQKVTGLLNVEPQPPAIDFNEVYAVLSDTRQVLTTLAYVFTGALVAFVTYLSFSRRRREIGVKRSRGFYPWQLLVELVTEATVLCVAGGLLGLVAGFQLCAAISRFLPALPLEPRWEDIWIVFPVVVGLSFMAAALVASYFAVRASMHQEH